MSNKPRIVHSWGIDNDGLLGDPAVYAERPWKQQIHNFSFSKETLILKCDKDQFI